MELNGTCFNTTLRLKKSPTTWNPPELVVRIFISVLGILLCFIVIITLFKKRHQLGAIIWLLIHFFVIVQLHAVTSLDFLPNRGKPVGDSIFGCVISVSLVCYAQKRSIL